MGYINECSNLYLNEFPENWLEKADAQSDKSAYWAKLFDFEKKAFVLLSKSVLSGEYINNPRFETNINTFISVVIHEKIPFEDHVEIETHKRTIESIKDKIAFSEKRVYEIIGLFTAVLTFLFGSINIFTSNDQNIQQLIVNTSGLGIVLLLFLSVFLMTSPLYTQPDLSLKRYVKSRRFFFGLLSVAVYVMLIVVLMFDLSCKAN